MLRNIIISTVVLCLVGCTGYIRESDFITQNKPDTDIEQIDIKALRDAFPKQEVTQLEIVTGDPTATLRGLYLDNPDSQNVILFIPGNGMALSTSALHLFKRFAGLNKDIVYFDRRGLGTSDGQATIAALGSDSVEKLHYIREHLNPDRVIVHGLSLGSFAAAQLAKTETIDALVLEGTATNVDDWIDKLIPWYTKPFLTIEVDPAFYLADNEEALAQHYTGPLLIIGAEKDDQVPIELSSMLFDASQSVNKKLLIVKGASHGSMLDNPKEILVYKQFLESIGTP